MLGWLQIPEVLRNLFLSAQARSEVTDLATVLPALECVAANPTLSTKHQIAKALQRLGVLPRPKSGIRIPTTAPLFSAVVELCKRAIPEKDQESSAALLACILENTDFAISPSGQEAATCTKLTPAQSAVFVQSALLLPHFGCDPMNTGNLQDLVMLTLNSEVGTPKERVLQAFVELWADAFKTLPIPDDAQLSPPLVCIRNNGAEPETLLTFGALKQATGLNDADAMVVAHPSLAFGHQAVRDLATTLIRSTMPEVEIDEWMRWMLVLTQHGPSSSYVRDRSKSPSGVEPAWTLEPDFAGLLQEPSSFAPSAEGIIRFYSSFAIGALSDADSGASPLQTLFRRLPPALQESMRRDLISSFQPATLQSGKWVAIKALFDQCTRPTEVLKGIAEVANQYCVDWTLLGGTSEEFRQRVREPLLDYLGIAYDETTRRFEFPDDANVPVLVTEQMDRLRVRTGD
jgi:hypothetical protein